MNELEQARLSISSYFTDTAIDSSEALPTGGELAVKAETLIDEPPTPDVKEHETTPTRLRKKAKAD